MPSRVRCAGAPDRGQEQAREGRPGGSGGRSGTRVQQVRRFPFDAHVDPSVEEELDVARLGERRTDRLVGWWVGADDEHREEVEVGLAS